MAQYKVKPKVFIMGVSGFLGYRLAHHLRKDYCVSGAFFRNPVFIPDAQTYRIDAKSPDLVEYLINVEKPDYCISTIGVQDQSVAEKEPKLAEFVNITLPLSMAIAGNKVGAKVIVLSCSSVFQGLEGNYDEKNRDLTIQGIGKSKASTEVFVRAQTQESMILRVGKIMGVSHLDRPGLFDRLRIRANYKQPIHACESIHHSFLSIQSFLAAIDAILSFQFPRTQQLFHLGGVNASETDMAETVVKLLGANPSLIKPASLHAHEMYTLNCSLFERTYPWQRESREEFLRNLALDLQVQPNSKGLKTSQIQ